MPNLEIHVRNIDNNLFSRVVNRQLDKCRYRGTFRKALYEELTSRLVMGDMLEIADESPNGMTVAIKDKNMVLKAYGVVHYA